MKTGIDHSKYCIPQPFSSCLISLCRFFFTIEYIGLNDIRVQVGIVQPKGGGGGETPHMKGVGMLVGNFELNP